MDWQFRCCAQISGIAFFILITVLLSIFSQEKKFISDFDKKIKHKNAIIDSIRAELERGRNKIKELNKKETTYLTQLELLEKNLEASNAYLKNVIENIDTITIHIDILKDSIDILTKALSDRQFKMKKRLKNIYMTGRPTLIEILFTAKNISDILRRNKYFQTLNRYDRELLLSIDSTRISIHKNKETLETEQEQLVSLKESKEKESLLMEVEQAQRKEVLKDVQAEKKAYEIMVKELVLAQKELNLLIKRLEERRKKAKVEFEQGLKMAFEKRKGELPWPVDGRVIREYGKIVHPVYKTVTMSNGIDIKIAPGEKVFCVAPGTVDYVGWMRGYGKFIIINHFGGYLTIYAHLNEITVAQNDEIKYGAVLGTTGDTGSLTGPKLHFQIRHSSETLNPRKWLEKRE